VGAFRGRRSLVARRQSVETPLMDVGRVDRELTELWRQNADAERVVLRACTYNLVIIGSGPSDADDATAVGSRLSESQPGRAIVVVPSDEKASGLDARVSTHSHPGPGGAQVCCEQITIEVGSGDEELVPGTVLHLLAEDVPVFIWWRRSLRTRDAMLAPL